MSDPQLELYYRKPGSDEYVKINESLDEIFNRLVELEEIVSKLEHN